MTMKWDKRTCKRCNEEVITYTSGGFGEMANYHSYCYTELLEERKQKKLLDEVLIKFEKPSTGNYLYYGLVLHYSLYDNKFRITGSKKPLSIETVSAILNDLERDD